MIKFRVILLSITMVACNQSGVTNVSVNDKDKLQDHKPNDTIINIDPLKEAVAIDTNKLIQSIEIKSFQKEFLDSIVNFRNGEFETDSVYKISVINIYTPYQGDTIFYIKGFFLPSKVDFHYYGGYNRGDLYEEIFHLPVRTWFRFTKYEILDREILFYGILRDDHSEGEGEVVLFNLKH